MGGDRGIESNFLLTLRLSKLQKQNMALMIKVLNCFLWPFNNCTCFIKQIKSWAFFYHVFKAIIMQKWFCNPDWRNKTKHKLLHIKDLFQFSTIVSVSTEFGGQMGVGGGGDWWGQTGDDSSVGVAHKTILKDCRGQVSGEGISMAVKILGCGGNAGKQGKQADLKLKKGD